MGTPPGNAPSRAARARCARRLAGSVLLLSLAGLLASWFLAERLLLGLDNWADHAHTRLVSALCHNHGLDFYSSLDDRVPTDFFTDTPLLGAGSVRVPGVFGSARRFDGRPGENLVVPRQRWSHFARGGFTLAFWASLLPGAASPESRLVWDRGKTSGIGLRVVGDRLEATVGDATGLRSLSAPAPAPGRPVHIALSVGPGRAALYVDGHLCGDCDAVPPFTLHGHCVFFGTDIHFPPAADVDEWGIWRRPLDPSEVARLAAARHPLPALLEPRRAACLRRREALAAFFHSLFSTLGALRPSISTPAVLNPAFPSLNLRLSGDDRRHFRAAHLEALSSGFRTPLGARRRHVQASFGARSERVAAWLDEIVPAPPLSSRPAFVLASTNGLFGAGSGLVRLYPPEQFGVRRPDAARPLPLDPSSLVRLHLNGDFLGLYCLAPFESPAPPSFATGPRELNRPDRLHFATPAPGADAGAGFSPQERDDAWRAVLSLLATDPGFPLSSPEANLLARRHDLAKTALDLPDPVPAPASTARPPALPAPSPLPALHLHFTRPLDKLRRTDFVCRLDPPGTNASPVWLSGSGGSCGAKLRGNTSYLTGRRRSIGLKFADSVSFPGLDAPVRHLLLLSGYADPTRLRNALSFEAFRAMSPPGTVRAVPVFWAEVYVNGAWSGVWECCPRLRDVVSEPFSALYKVRAPHGLWTSPAESAEVVDRVAPADGDVTDPDPYAPFRDLVRFVAEASPSDFAAAAPSLFDLDELVDFFLLVNFTGNEDGRVTNQFAARRASDGRWLLLPWDYDKTFLPARAGTAQDAQLLLSPLFDRLDRDLPGFRDRIAARWRDLRAGPLSDDALDAWLDARSALLAPLLSADYALLPPIGHDGDYPAAVAVLRARLHDRLSLLDRFSSAPR